MHRQWHWLAVVGCVVVMASITGCEDKKTQTKVGTVVSSTGGLLANTGIPGVREVGVLLIAGGGILLLDAAVSGDSDKIEEIPLTDEQRADLAAGRSVEVIDKEGNRRTVKRRYAPTVKKVLPGSAAESLGIQPGDILVSYNGTFLASSSNTGNPVQDVLQQAANQGFVSLVINRNGREIRYSVFGGARLGVEYRLE